MHNSLIRNALINSFQICRSKKLTFLLFYTFQALYLRSILGIGLPRLRKAAVKSSLGKSKFISYMRLHIYCPIDCRNGSYFLFML